MSRIYLQEMVEDIRFDGLPVNWNAFDIAAFSKTKTFWNYQGRAVENAIKVLWKYYEDFGDYQANESAEANRERKQKFFKWYRDNGLDEDLHIPLTGNHRLAGLLTEYYEAEDEKISYNQFINRACFWMATGSGKTLVIVKLIEILCGLILRGEIPPHDILVLTCRDDLIGQLKQHVASHYYIPMILSEEKERIDYIKHIIQISSEIKFVNDAEAYLSQASNKFKDFDWWMFSKLDESLDQVYVPYYDGTANKVREFKPDFLFWLQRGDDYFIVFIDPKGAEHTEYQRKIDGYSAIFEEADGGKKALGHDGKKVRVFTFLHTDNVDGLPQKYKRYWFDDVGKLLASVLAST